MKKLNKKCVDDSACKFSEAYYQKMASRRYGVKFCCEQDLSKWGVLKELNDLNNLKDPIVEVDPCPIEICDTTCIDIGDLCGDSYGNLLLLLSKGALDNKSVILAIESTASLFDDTFREHVLFMTSCYMGDDKCFDTISRNYRTMEYICLGLSNFTYQPDSEESKALNALLNLLYTHMIKIEELFREYYLQFDTWMINDYSDSFLPTYFDDLFLSYTNCSGVVMTVPFSKRLTIYNQPDSIKVLGPNYEFNELFFSKLFIVKQSCPVLEVSCVYPYMSPNNNLYTENMPYFYGNWVDSFTLSQHATNESWLAFGPNTEDYAASFRELRNYVLRLEFETRLQNAINYPTALDPDKIKYGYIKPPNNQYYYYTNSPSEIWTGFELYNVLKPKSLKAEKNQIDYIKFQLGLGPLPGPDIEGCEECVEIENLVCDFYSCEYFYDQGYCSVNELPTVGVWGVRYYVLEKNPFNNLECDCLDNSNWACRRVEYFWNPITKSYANQPWWGGYDLEDCNTIERIKRDAFFKAVNEHMLSQSPFYISNISIPKFQIETFKTNGQQHNTDCSTCDPFPGLRFDLEDYLYSCVIGAGAIDVCCLTWEDMRGTARATRDAMFKSLSELILSILTSTDCHHVRIETMKTLYYDLFQDCYINFVKAQEIFFNHLICIDEQSEGIVNSYVRLNVPCAFRKPDENDREITVFYDIDFGTKTDRFNEQLWINFVEAMEAFDCCRKKLLSFIGGMTFQNNLLPENQLCEVFDGGGELPNACGYIGEYGTFTLPTVSMSESLCRGKDLVINFLSLNILEENEVETIHYRVNPDDAWTEFDITTSLGKLVISGLVESFTFYYTKDPLDVNAEIIERSVIIKHCN